MKKILSIGFFFACTVVLLAAEVTIKTFTAKSTGNDISIEWVASKEVSVQQYELERSVGSQNDYKTVAIINPVSAEHTYRYIDENAFMKDNDGNSVAGTYYAYRLKITGTDHSITYSDRATVIHTVSSVKRTWGMIKEMFR